MPAIDTQHGRPAARPPRGRPKSSGVKPNFPSYVPPRPGATKPKPVKPPSRTQIAHQQEQQYHSQAGAVRRAAKTQKTLGPGVAVRPPKGGRQVLTDAMVRKAKREQIARQTEQGYKSQGRAVEKAAKQQKAAASKGGSGPPVAVVKPAFGLASLIGKGASAYSKPIIAALGEKGDMGGMQIIPSAVKTVGHAGKDVYGAITGAVPSAVHEATGVYAETKKKGPIKGGEKLVKDLAEPYGEALKHPGKALTEHPVTTPLMFVPGVRLPGRVAGRGARLVGKQTLKGGEATLPGTALTEVRHRSKDAIVNARQARRDRKRGGPAPINRADVERRVDEHVDVAIHRGRDAEIAAAQEAKKLAKRQGLSRAERKQAMQDAADYAREHHHEDAQVAAAREFGANVRPSTSAAEVELTHGNRMSAWMRLQGARARRAAADVNAKTAYAKAKEARLKTKASSRLEGLRSQLAAAQRDLSAAQKAALRAQRNRDKATADARVSVATSPTTPRMRELHSLREGALKAEPSWGVKTVRKQVSEADKRVNAIKRQLQREEENASRLEGVTQGRTRAGKMTSQAGRAAADAADRVGRLRDALGEATGEAKRLRSHLREVEGTHRSRVGRQVQELDRQLAEEHARVKGVAPAQHQALLDALEAHAAAPGHVKRARERVRGINEQIAAEQKRISGVPPEEHQALLDALDERAAARADYEGVAAKHSAARTAHINTKLAHRNAALVGPTSEGRLFSHEADAKRVANTLNEQAHEIKSGATSPVHLRTKEPDATGVKNVTLHGGRATTPLEFTVRKVGDEHYAVLPKIVTERIYGSGAEGARLPHSKVGASASTGAKVMRTTRGLFTQATLPVSLKWLGGQAGEGAIRSLLTGSGPVDWARMQLIVKRMNKAKPGSGDDALRRVTGGQWGPTSGVATQLADRTPFAEVFSGSAAPLRVSGQMATWLGERPPFRQMRNGWHRYMNVVMHDVNGFIERNTRMAMAGQHVRHGALMEDRALGLTKKALDQAADGLKGTPEQVQAGRAVDDMYGKYSKHSPEMRSMLLHWTPFLPWYLNATKFLLHVLPADHPVSTSLVASVDQLHEDWRRSQHLIPGEKDALPDFMQGGYPTKGGILPVSHYGPTGVAADPLGSISDLVLPQFGGALKNLGGVDWKYERLKEPGPRGREFTKPERALRAGVSFAEGQVPLVSQIGNLSGLTPRYVDRKGKFTPGFETRAKKLSPTTPIKRGKPPKGKKKSSGFGSGGFGSGGFGSGGFGSGD